MRALTTAITAAGVLAAPVGAKTRVPARARTVQRVVEIDMTDAGFAPAQVSLRGGAAYTLRVVNRSAKTHNLEQKRFFELAAIAPEDRGWTRDGRISLRTGETATVHLRAPLTRPGGTFQFSSTVLADAAKNYKGVFLIR